MAASDQRVALNDAATRLQGVRAAGRAAAQTLTHGRGRAAPSWSRSTSTGARNATAGGYVVTAGQEE